MGLNILSAAQILAKLQTIDDAEGGLDLHVQRASSVNSDKYMLDDDSVTFAGDAVTETKAASNLTASWTGLAATVIDNPEDASEHEFDPIAWAIRCGTDEYYITGVSITGAPIAGTRSYIAIFTLKD